MISNFIGWLMGTKADELRAKLDVAYAEIDRLQAESDRKGIKIGEITKRAHEVLLSAQKQHVDDVDRLTARLVELERAIEGCGVECCPVKASSQGEGGKS